MKSKDIVLTFINALNQEDFAAAKNCLDGNMNFKGVLGSREGADVYIEDSS